METSVLPLKLYQFNSGVMVLQLSSLDSDSIAEGTAILVSANQHFLFSNSVNWCDQVEDYGSLSAEELSQKLGISVTLAKERLLVAEKFGKTCRDDSIEGLRFYPNLFLTREE